MKKLMLDKLSEPFSVNLPYLIFFFILSATVDTIGFSTRETISKALYIAMHHVCFCYLLTLTISFIPIKLKNIYISFITLLLMLSSIIDAICVIGFKFTFDRDIPAIILGTNPAEASEFIATFFSWQLAGALLIIIFATFFSLVHARKSAYSMGPRSRHYGLLLILVCFAIPITMNSKNWKNLSIGKLYTFCKAANTPDLSNRIIPKFQIHSKDCPDNIIIIIGESFSRSHSSLYGYGKETNPLLSKRRDAGNLIVFNNVTSAETHTIESFKRFMSGVDDESFEYHKHMTLIDVMKNAGYSTSWISNQAKSGFYENWVTNYAKISDRSAFMGHVFGGQNHNDLDEIIIPELKKHIDTAGDGRNFYVVHLMGSHPYFPSRYPKTFSRFSPEQYERHGVTLSSYDTSIAYNDSVVNEIFHCFDSKDALILYFPDHGLDMFDSSDDFFGHAIHGNKRSIEAASNIPFVIHMTDLSKSLHPHLFTTISSSATKNFNTRDLIYTMMDLTGTYAPEKNKWIGRSLFYNSANIP